MKFNQYARNLQRQKLEQARWLQKRKQTNEERRAAGDGPLPDEEFALDKKVMNDQGEKREQTTRFAIF